MSLAILLSWFIDITVYYYTQRLQQFCPWLPAGLKTASLLFLSYCNMEETIISLAKTEILPFSKYPKQWIWQLGKYTTEQVKAFKYLGIVFQVSGNWNVHLDYIFPNAQKSISVVQAFLFILTAIKLFCSWHLSTLLLTWPAKQHGYARERT